MSTLKTINAIHPSGSTNNIVLDASGNVAVGGTVYSASISVQAVQTGNFTAVAGYLYPVNTTSAAITVTLPASPSAGNVVTISDYAGTFATNKCTVSPNGGKIAGSTSSANFAINRESISFIYIDSTQGWLLYSGLLSNPLSYTASYLIAAGGGGGGASSTNVSNGSGAGAGGLLTGTSTLSIGTVYNVVVGAGGAGGAVGANIGTVGSDSSGLGLTANGGGRGGNSTTTTSGGNGGSGGGAAANAAAAGTGTSGQGFAGGTTTASTGVGGGGGAGAVGSNGASSTGGAGGIGIQSSITGVATYYSGGGGGAGDTTYGLGGSGGGGRGGQSGTQAAVAGTANTGGGGGGSSGAASQAAGGTGGSGVVILSVPTANYSGTTTGSPTVTTSGSNTIIKFTGSGSYTA